jgi:hypothetical protein
MDSLDMLDNRGPPRSSAFSQLSVRFVRWVGLRARHDSNVRPSD